MLSPVAAPGPGRPATIDRESITDAVLVTGFDGLTVAAVARELGVSHAALYHHVRGRDDLVRLAVDRLVATAPWPERGPDWRPFLARVAWVHWGVLRAHPGLVEQSRTLDRPPPGVLAHVERVGEHLRALGFSAELTALAVDTVVDLVSDVAESSRRIEAAGEADFTVVHDAWRRFGDGSEVDDAHDRWFALKLGLVLDGLAAALRKDHP